MTNKSKIKLALQLDQNSVDPSVNAADCAPCAICGRPMEERQDFVNVSVALFIAGTDAPVCNSCGSKHSLELVQALALLKNFSNVKELARFDAEWGVCPVCRENDGCLTVGYEHWYYCVEHKKKWCVGEKLFSTWMDRVEERQAIYDALDFGSYEVVN